MKTKILVMAVLSIAVLFTACEKDQLSQDARISLGFKAVESVSLLKSTDSLVIDSAMIGISEIEIESEQEAEMENDSVEMEMEQEIEYEWEGAYRLNLLAGTRLSDVVPIEPGIYTEIEAEIAPVLDSNRSIYVRAQYTDSTGQSWPVEYYTSESIDFEVENEQGIQINDQQVTDLLVRINLQEVFGSINLDDAARTDSGTILINEEYNENLAEQLKEYLEDHSEFKEDDEDDEDDDEEEQEQEDDDEDDD